MTTTSEDGTSSVQSSRITSIKPLPEPKEEALTAVTSSSETGLAAFQLVTTEEGGILTVWTVLDARHDLDLNLGLAHWGTLR